MRVRSEPIGRSSRSAEDGGRGRPGRLRLTRLRGVRSGGPSWGSLRFDGELDAGAVAVVRASCLAFVDGCDVIELDLGRVTVFTAAGTRLLEHLAGRVERRGGVLTLGATSQIVDRVLDALRLDDPWPARRRIPNDPKVEVSSGRYDRS